jgi:trans-aconitate methyltransferase
MDDHKRADCQASYDAVADEYVRRIFDELRHKPLDRELLDRFAARVRDVGLVCDMGCGPGQVARYLYERGVEVCGIDLSPAMVERARHLNPGVEFRQGDFLRSMPLTVPGQGLPRFIRSSTSRATTCRAR